MRRTIYAAAVLLFTITGALFAQVVKDNLAVLPFTGGVGNEGDTIAVLLSLDPNLAAKFGIIPRTGIASAIAKEQSFQTTSGMTNADTIAALGAQLGAKYVMAGSITALGAQKLLVVTIIRIETIQQVAGDYLTYNRIEELPAKFSDMMKTLLPLLDVDTSALPKLAVLPVLMQGGATNQGDADTLAQILAIYLLRNKRYAIYPRTSSLEKVQQEFKTQQSGVTADKNAAQSGYGVNPGYVLSVASRKLGAKNMFNAATIDLAAGTQLQGVSENYGALSDGIKVMESIARTLSGGKMSDFTQVGKDNLAILPFTGGAENEGNAIAELLSFDANLMAKFGIMPRTGIADAIKKEQGFQTSSGMTNADTIAALGAQLGAKYVMAGSITALGNLKLLVVTIVRIETIQQVAGDFLMYTEINELPAKFPGMLKSLLPLLEVNTSNLPKLAVLPVQMQGGGATNQRDADTLAQILAISLLRNKGYAIYPRTSSLEKVQEEFKTQRSGVTADKNAAQSGYGVNPEYVLSVASRKLGEMNTFNAAIIDLAAGTIVDGKGTSEDYGLLSNGIPAMEIIARVLSTGKISDKERRQYEKENSVRIAAANRGEAAVNRVVAAQIAEVNRDEFLRTSGVIFGLQGGLFIPFNDGQFFGEPEPEPKSSETSETGETSAAVIGFRGGLVVALKLGEYFSIQSGVNFNVVTGGLSNLTYTDVQVPALLRWDFMFPNEDSWGIGFFGGPAFNFPLSASKKTSYLDTGEIPGQTATMTIPPMSGIAGVEMRIVLSSGFIINYGISATLDFGETKVTLADGHEAAFNGSSVCLGAGIKYFIPFRR
jgi:TolB-like protein